VDVPRAAVDHVRVARVAQLLDELAARARTLHRRGVGVEVDDGLDELTDSAYHMREIDPETQTRQPATTNMSTNGIHARTPRYAVRRCGLWCDDGEA